MLLELERHRTSERRFVQAGWTVSVAAVTAILLSFSAFKGWIPHDEGTLGLAAANIRRGLWPHIDFYDPYPGMLGVIHAGAFAFLGESIWAMRVAWLSVAGLVAAVSFRLLRNHIPILAAAAGAVGVSVIGFVAYSASMPTWWNLAFGLIAVALAIRGHSRSEISMVAIAGLVAGLGLLVKPVGIYFVLPVALWLSIQRTGARSPMTKSALGLTLVVVTAVVLPVLSPARLLFVWLPAVVGLLAVWWRARGVVVQRPKERSGEFAYPLVFIAAASAPAVVVAALYAMRGSIDALVSGWVLSPSLRYETVSGDIPLQLGAGVFLLGLILVFQLAVRRNLHTNTFLILMGLLVILLLERWGDFGQLLIATGVWLPMVLAVSMVLSPWMVSRSWTPLVAASALTFSLVVVPSFSEFYVSYTIPGLLLGLLLLMTKKHAAGLAFGLAAIGLVFVWQASQDRMFGPIPLDEKAPMVALESSRAGIEVHSGDGFYDDLVAAVISRAKGQRIYSGPDAPEVPFLAGVPSAHPAFFELLDPNWRPTEVVRLSALTEIAVLNEDPKFSSPIVGDDLERIRTELAGEEHYGDFEVRWRTGDD